MGKKISVVVKLKGGLGNQLFQYAFGKSIESSNNVNVIYDLSFYNNRIWDYRLKYFNVCIWEDKKLIDENWGYITCNNIMYKRILNKLINKFKIYKTFKNKYYDEKNLMFDSNVYNIKNNVYFDGYWQSERYFKQIRERLLEQIKLKNDMSEDAKEYAQNIISTNSICIHIRRGDMAEDTRINKVHGLCSMQYYNKAIESIKSKVKNAIFYVFSDDIMWVKKNWKIEENHIYIDKKIYDFEELMLMALCKHNIIANSTFSWWGAWLGNNKDKVVIAPQDMFANGIRTEVLDVEGWIRI